MVRKANAGHVTGGNLFGYDRVRVDGHVERRINEGQAAIVRQIFELCSRGAGLKTIAKTLNADRVLAPKSQQGRPCAWAPTSVRAVLRNETYRGVIVWNKTRKRDVDGQKHQRPRPASDWIRTEAPQLQIVSEALWRAARGQLTERADNYRRWNGSATRTRVEARGGRQSYLLSGFARCAHCGGSMQAVSRASSKGRRFRYICSTYWNRGASVCGNSRMAAMEIVEAGIREKLANEVLRPAVIEAALDKAIAMLKPENERLSRSATTLRRRLTDVERTLANLTE